MLEHIQQSLEHLSKAEQRAGRWILAHPRQAAESTLAEVSREARISEPTVVRFCRSVGVSGFRELSRRLTEALSRPQQLLHQDVSADDASGDAVIKVFDATIRALTDARAALAGQPFDAAADLLRDARQVTFCGFGASGCVAADARHKYFRLGIPCSVNSDAPGVLQTAAVIGDGDVMLLISTRGQWPELIEAAREARARGAGVIALTRRHSPLAEAAAVLLACDAAEDTSLFTPSTSRIAQLALLDALLVVLSLLLGKPALDKLQASKTALTRALNKNS